MLVQIKAEIIPFSRFRRLVIVTVCVTVSVAGNDRVKMGIRKLGLVITVRSLYGDSTRLYL